MKTEFLFNTGVRARALGITPMPGQRVTSNGILVIPFTCHGVPEESIFAFACDDPNFGHDTLRAFEMHNTVMVSKYAYFHIKEKHHA